MMRTLRTLPRTCLTLLAVLVMAGLVSLGWAANHREAPITALDHKADITDWFAFVSYDDPTKVTMILNVDPLLEPSNGPNYFPFDPEILYEMKVDNDRNGEADIRFQFRFMTEIRLPQVFTGLVGAGTGSSIVPPAITALDGPGSAGLSLRQTYSVKMIKGTGRTARTTTLGSGLVAVPSNVGPRTMPDYDALAQQGIYDLGNGIRVFAGTVDDPFYIDLGATFDTLNFRREASPFGATLPGLLSDAQDALDTSNFAPDAVAGFNVNTIAIEVPITMLTSDGQRHPADDARAVIGTYGTTSRPRIKILPTTPGGKSSVSTNFLQIQRMGNPLINELIIGTGDKDKFSMSEPKNDGQFASYFLDPLLARVINDTFGGLGSVPPAPRFDLIPLVQYAEPICPACGFGEGPIADLLRLNTGIPATSQAERSRLGVLGGDFGGFPNGRRVSDDVTDIALRAVAGVLAGPPFDQFPNNRLGDGVNSNDRPYQEIFPYVAFANSGRNSRHVNPGERGCVEFVTPFAAQKCPVE